jgi:hypothetical protein
MLKTILDGSGDAIVELTRFDLQRDTCSRDK